VNRFYSAQQGRFTQVDPIGMSAASLSNPQTLNMYTYCGNDPVNHVDPNGLLFGWLSKVFKWVARVAAVALAVAAVLAVTWGYGAGLAIKLGLAAFKFALDGWGNSKWTRLLSAGIGAYFGFKLGQVGGTPPTFPFAEGGGSPWRSWLFAAVGAVYSFISQQKPAPKEGKKLDAKLFIQRYFRAFGKKLNDCIAKKFNNPQIPKIDESNAPDVNFSKDSYELGKLGDFSRYKNPPPEPRRAFAVPSTNEGKNGTIYIANDDVNSDADFIYVFYLYTHEIGNILSKKATGDSYTYGDPNGRGAEGDRDSGAVLDDCVHYGR